MASRPKKRDSKELPPNFSELLNKLLEHAASFIQQFDTIEPEMRDIVQAFLQLSREIKEMQKVTDATRRTGAVVGGVGLGVLILIAPFTGGLSLIAAVAAAAAGAPAVVAAAAGAAAVAAAAAGAAAVAAAVAAAGAAAPAAAVAAAGAAAVVGANVTKLLSEKGGAEKVEKWGKEFIALVEPMKENLEEIKTTCEKLEEKAAEAQADKTQADLEKFQRILRQVSELKEKSEGAVIESSTVLKTMGEIVKLILSVIRVTSTPEQDKNLGNTIIQSADQCETVVNKFDEMKNKLKEFRGL